MTDDGGDPRGAGRGTTQDTCEMSNLPMLFWRYLGLDGRGNLNKGCRHCAALTGYLPGEVIWKFKISAILNFETNQSTYLKQHIRTAGLAIDGLHDDCRCVKNGAAAAEGASLKVGISNFEICFLAKEWC